MSVSPADADIIAPHDLPPPMRRLLHRALHHLSLARHAERQACGRAVRAARRATALQGVRPTRASGLLRRVAGCAGDVRGITRTCVGLVGAFGAGNATAGIMPPHVCSPSPSIPHCHFRFTVHRSLHHGAG